MSALDKAWSAIDLKFRSGNAVPIDRAWVRKGEWDALRQALVERGYMTEAEFNAEAEKARGHG